MLHRGAADRAQALVGLLADLFSDVPADPLAPDWLATPSEGMRRWAMLELASRLGSSGPGRSDGICANIEQVFPGRLRGAVLAADGTDWTTDPWVPNRLAWSVLEILADGSRASALGVPLAPDASRYATARQIADHFDQYHVHRPAMVRAWAEGQHVDGFGRPLPPDAAWQPRLWQAVREGIDQPSAPERWPGLLERLRNGRLELDLPSRLVFFGFSLLPSGDFLELLGAVAATRDVHLLMLQPVAFDSAELAGAAHPPEGKAAGGLRPRGDGDVTSVPHHPLLRSWGRELGETALLLSDAETHGLVPRAAPSPATDERSTLGGPDLGAPDTLLGRLQADLRANRAAAPTLRPAGDDRSVQFHACYGPARQVAALGDALRHQLADHPDLREEDIVVLCPALDRFAPLLEAVLGPSAPASSSAEHASVADQAPGTAPALRYRVVDQSVRSTNDAVEATLAMLDLVSGRFEAPAVVDFLSRLPVRTALGFDEDQLADIDRWVVGTRVRWGLDPEQRARFGLSPSVRTNSWRAALDRLLVGSVVDVDGLAVASGDVVPYPLDAGAVGALGRLAEALRILGALAEATGSARPLPEWIDMVAAAVRTLVAVPAETAWQLDAVERSLTEALDAAGPGGAAVTLSWGEARRVLGEYLVVRRGRNDYFRGGITVTSLVPLRDVPFRVVCLLGMDQLALSGGYPAGDDLVQSRLAVGDRDPRSDLRQGLLAAVLAAGDQLLVFRDGHNPRTNQRIPRAVALDELIESVAASVHPDGRREVVSRLEVDHPCHPFAEPCFAEGALVDGVRWSFGQGDLDGARARRRRNAARAPFLTEPLAPADGGVLELADLHAFLADPTGAFLSQRLGIRLPRSQDRPESVLPVEVGGLSRWQIGDRLLRARLDGRSIEEWAAYERGLGTLPPGHLGEHLLEEVEGQVGALLDRAAELGVGGGPGSTEPIDLELADGTRVVGAVPLDLAVGGPGPALVTFSQVKPSHRVRAWLDLMALSVSRPEVHWRSVVVTRKKNEAEASDYRLAPAGGDAPSPEECLSLAVDLYRRGMNEPLPVFPALSEKLTLTPDRVTAADWRRAPGSLAPPAEGEVAAVELVYGRCDVDDVLDVPARPGDPGRKSEASRARRLGQHLYCAVLASMRDAAKAWSKSGRSRTDRKRSTARGPEEAA
jgi:exodeoxyribonuclease V gamma subunit